MASIVWIASYPRSGNTWLRFLLANLLFGEVKSSTQLQRLIPDIHRGIAGVHLWGTGTTLVKTHWCRSGALPLKAETIGVIYLLRDPVDVMCSNLRHAMLRSGRLLTEADATRRRAAAEAFVEAYLAAGGHPGFLRFGLGTWQGNVASWLEDELPFPRLILRYEDLEADTAAALGRVSRFLGQAKVQEDFARAVDASSLQAMRTIEEAEIASGRDGYFYQARNQAGFALGLRFVGGAGSGPPELAATPEQRQRARATFAAAAAGYGY
jgi:hypothetical protein